MFIKTSKSEYPYAGIIAALAQLQNIRLGQIVGYQIVVETDDKTAFVHKVVLMDIDDTFYSVVIGKADTLSIYDLEQLGFIIADDNIHTGNNGDSVKVVWDMRTCTIFENDNRELIISRYDSDSDTTNNMYFYNPLRQHNNGRYEI